MKWGINELKMKISSMLIVLCAVISFGCSYARGPLFKEISMEEHKGKAIVYFYRYSSAAGITTLNLTINDEAVLPLQNHGNIRESSEYSASS